MVIALYNPIVGRKTLPGINATLAFASHYSEAINESNMFLHTCAE